MLGNTLLIANPVSQSGYGARAAESVAAFLREHLDDDALRVVFTAQQGHACEIAANAHGFSHVIALGGDGAIHEVANGLMTLTKEERPILGIIPTGSGNDYAKALKIPTDLDAACKIIMNDAAYPVDVGLCNGVFFTETVSFGLDAAIALDTMERRKKSGRHGTILYMESGINQLFNHLDSFAYTASFDGGELVSGESITFAVQNGPYYGGGFKICPDAKLDDGIFDICIGHPPISVPSALALFMRAKSGKHTGSKSIELLRAKRVHVEFNQAPPTQIDGELLESRIFDISIEHDAIRVIRPA